MATDAFYFDPGQQQQHFGYPEEPQAGKSKTHSDCEAVTLLVRHLPEAISQEVLQRLFFHYGASAVRPCAGGRLRNSAFVDFKSEVLASQAQSQLNRLRFLGKVLSVERASMPTTNKKQTIESISAPVSLLIDTPATGNITKGGAVPGSMPIGEPVASKLGVDYPFPPQLEYAYPPPDGNILINIVNALIAVPRLYTQVLHLMNKMNLPAPFRAALPTPPLPPSMLAPPPPPPPTTAKPHLADLSNDESELESSEEGDINEKSYPGEVTRRALHGRKRAKREAIIGPAIDKAVSHEAVGLKPATLVPKEIPTIKKKNPVLQIKITPKTVQNKSREGDTVKEVTESVNADLEVKPYATLQEIENAKLPPEEILSLPMFKNYTAGNPTTVLYIKNLAKDVAVDDFYFIFGSLFGSVEAVKSGISVKLMQEGRMRGQAFVTFPSIELAEHALKMVNGYVFKSKPMIIQFGRNPAAGKAN